MAGASVVGRKGEDLLRKWVRGVVGVSALILLCLSLCATVNLTNGNPIPSLAIPATILALVLFAVRLDVGLYVFLACVLLFDQFEIFHLQSITWNFGSTFNGFFHRNLNNTLRVEALKMNPLEIFLGYLLAVWFVKGLIKRDFEIKPLSCGRPVLGILGLLAFFLAWGTVRGGYDFTVSLWELRALFYFGLLYFFIPQVITGPHGIKALVWVILGCIAFKAFQGLWRYFVVLGMSMGPVETVTNHEDALFFTHLFVLLMALALFRAGTAQRHFLWVMLPPIFLCFVVTQRRIAYGAAALGLLFAFLMIPKELKAKFLKPAIVLLLVWSVYYPAFKNSTGGVGMLANQVSSIFKDDSEDLSNLYRNLEKLNCFATIQSFPLGIGFGRKYVIAHPVARTTFPLWDYIPHNSFLWLWLKMGYAGFALLLLGFGLLIVRATMVFRRFKTPYFKALAIVAVTSLANQFVVAYYDLQLTYYRDMILLACWVALVEAARNVERLNPVERK